MPDDLATQLHQLQHLRALIGEASYAESLDRLRAQHGPDAVGALLGLPAPLPTPARSHDQTITAPVDIAVAGDVHGNIYLYGQRTPSHTQLLADYLQRLIARCDALPLQALREQRSADDRLPIRLAQVYTQLATTTLVVREVLEGDALAAFDAAAHTGAHLLPQQQRLTFRPSPLDDQRDERGQSGEPGLALLVAVNTDIIAAYAAQGVAPTFFGPQLVTEAIAAQPRLVLLGEPGSGKSTALRYLALALAEAAQDATIDLAARLEGWGALGAAGRLLPISLPLLPLAQQLAAHPARAGSADDLWNHLAAQLESGGRYAGLAAAVHTELAQGRALLLLDGLDEVAGAGSRRQVIQAVRAFADAYPACRMVVACRVRAYLGEHNRAWQLPDWPTATLADWTVGQMAAFVAAWYAAVGATGSLPPPKCAERQAVLQRAITTRADLQRLGVRPLLLTIMALVHLNDGRLPEDRVTLYSRCIDILLGQWELAGKDESAYGTLLGYIGLPDMDAKSLRPLLTRAAFQAHESATHGTLGRLGRAELRELVAQMLEAWRHPNPWDGATRFLEYADLRAGLLQASDAGDAYTFPHQTFQEYLAGLELVRGVEFVQRIMERRDDDRWRVPIMLGVGHLVSEGALAMPYQLLSELLLAEGRAEAQRQRDLILAAEIAKDVGWDRLAQGGATFARLRRDLAQALAEVVEGRALPAEERVWAGKLLGAPGDPRPGVSDLPPAMAQIAGGSFVIGNTPEEYQRIVAYEASNGLGDKAKDAYKDTVNTQPVAVAAFEVARYPVTNAQYAQFIAAGGYDPDQPWWDAAGRAWLARDDTATAGLHNWQRRQRKDQPAFWDNKRRGQTRTNQPVVGISWHEAVAFCRWLTLHLRDGWVYRLPSEAEWEYAARGPERRTYPWGTQVPNDERANFDQRYYRPTTVGCFSGGATPDGLFDMAGNVWEWTSSAYTPYPYDPHDGREQPDSPAAKALRGGGWLTRPFLLRPTYRNHILPDGYLDHMGMRLARHRPQSAWG